MPKWYVIYNPLAGTGNGEADAKLLDLLDEELEYYDMTRITNYTAFLGGLDQEDCLVIAGGDGTLNRFVNATAGIQIRQQILYFPVGTGNDFARDFGKKEYDMPFPVTQHLQELPAVEVKGRQYRFVNGVGFGVDGYCCQVGDTLRKTTDKKVNYTGIAIKGLLLHFRPRKATVTVDGKQYRYKRVWVAPTMHGRFYGGGMLPAPEQRRTSGQLSVMVFHGAGRLRTLCVFPGIFKGKHIKHTRMVSVHTGREITVEFDRPTPLQIDGETVPDVTNYRAYAADCVTKNTRGFSGKQIQVGEKI